MFRGSGSVISGIKGAVARFFNRKSTLGGEILCGVVVKGQIGFVCRRTGVLFI